GRAVRRGAARRGCARDRRPARPRRVRLPRAPCCRRASSCPARAHACAKLTAYAPMSVPIDPATARRAPAVTPAMRQYLDAKQQYRDAILFFRMGDFYEMFYED